MPSRIRKIILFSAAGLVGFLLLLFLLISPIAEYLIEKNSKEWTGRIIRMKDLDINLFTGSVFIEKLEILEADDKHGFITCNTINTSINLFKAIKGEYVLNQSIFRQLAVNINELNGHYNFDDLIKKFTSEEPTPKEKSKPVLWFINNFSLQNSFFNYTVNGEEIRIGIKSLDLDLPTLNHDSKQIDLSYAFEFTTGGKLAGTWHHDLSNNNYRLIVATDGLEMKLIEQFVKPYMQLHSMTGTIDTQMDISGNLDSTDNLILQGTFIMKNLVLLDPAQNILMKSGNFEIMMDSVNTGTHYYKLDHLQADNLYSKYELYDNGDNWTRLAGPADTAGVSPDTLDYTNPLKVLAIYIKLMVDNYNVSSVFVKNIDFNNVELVYSDYSLPDPFTFTIDQAYFTINDLNTNSERLVLNSEMRLNKTGQAIVMLSVNPRDAMDMNMEWEVTELPFGSFNPYTTHYAGYPFIKGNTMYKSTNSIKNGMLKSSNRFVLLQPKVGDKKLKSIYDVPLKLAVILLRDPKGNIDLEIPIEGDLNNPKYKLGKVIWKTLLNLLTKAVTAPYNLIARAAGGQGKEADYSEILLKYSTSNLSEKEKEKVKTIAKGLKTMPELFVTFSQEYDSAAEIQILALSEARRRYAIEKGLLSLNDSLPEKIIDNISPKDSLFLQWLTVNAGSEIESEIQKCIRIVGQPELIAWQRKLVNERDQNLILELGKADFPASHYKLTTSRSRSLPPGSHPSFRYTVGTDSLSTSPPAIN